MSDIITTFIRDASDDELAREIEGVREQVARTAHDLGVYRSDLRRLMREAARREVRVTL